jgi:FkbM family methyltransferase
MGIVSPTLYSYHDLLTVNEIFCRQDYKVDPNARVVVDIGANIGISGLYFLTRNPNVRCHLFEPVPRNVERLRANLAAFGNRIVVSDVAVADSSGTVDFGVEDAGRYGGIGVDTGRTIQVECRHIDDVLESVLQTEERIDLLKLDTEGLEAATVAAIHRRYLARIGRIAYEQAAGATSTVIQYDPHVAPMSAAGLHAVLPFALAAERDDVLRIAHPSPGGGDEPDRGEDRPGILRIGT